MMYLVVLSSVVITGCGREDFVEISYNPDFVRLVENGRVNTVEHTHDGAGVRWIRGKVIAGEGQGIPEKFKVRITSRQLQEASTLFKENNVVFKVVPPKPMAGAYVTPMILPLLIALIWIAIIFFVLKLALRLVRAVERIAENMDK